MKKIAKPNCHILKLLYLEQFRFLIAFMPAATRFHCIFVIRNLGTLAFVVGCAVGQLNFGVY
jgi:hypothetical protein